MSEQLRQAVLSLYAEVDREVAAAGPVCVASGKCCRFKEYGHTLFLSSLEAEVLPQSFLSMKPSADDSSCAQDAASSAFPITHWSIVLAAGADDFTRATAALERLCRTYWYP